MAIQVFGAPAAVIMLNRAFADTSPGNLIYQNQVAAATANQTAFANDFGAGYASLSDAALAELVLGNLGLLPNDALKTALADYYHANGAANRGFVTLQLGNILATLEGDATYGAAATAWNSEVASSYAYSANTSNTSSSTANASVGQSYTLTTSVDAMTGTAYADVYEGASLDSGATLNTGDVINAGGGSDTLNIVAQGADPTIFLNSVETVNVRMLSAETLSALSWSGTTNVNITSNSVDDTELTITNAANGITFGVADDNDLEVNYLTLTGSADTALLTLTAAGSSGDNARLDVGSATNALEAVSIVNAGSSWATIEAGASATAYTVAGTGSLTLSTDDTIGVLDMSGFSGTTSVTLSGVSNVRVTGGTGNDTVAFGGTFNSNDTVVGGEGTDIVTLTNTNSYQTFSNVSRVETLRAKFSGSTATLGLSGASFSTVSLTDASATTITLNDIGANVTVDVQADDDGFGGALTLDYAANATATVTFAAATAAATLGAVSITDAATINITSTGGSGTKTLGDLTVDTDLRTLSITAGGSATMAFASGGLFDASRATTVTLSAGGSASLTFDESVLTTAASLTTLTLIATGDNDNDLRVGSGYMGSGGNLAASGTLTLEASATDGAGIYLDGVIGKSSTYSITVSVGDGSDFGDYSAGNVGSDGVLVKDSAGAGTLSTFVVTAGASAYVEFDDLNMGSASGAVSDISATAGSSGYVAIDNVIAKSIGDVTLAGAGSATIDALEASTIGDIEISTIGGATLTKVGSATGAVGNITVASTVDAPVTVTVNGSSIGAITLGSQSGTTTVTVSGTTVGTIDATAMSAGATLALNADAVTNGLTISLGAGTNTVHSSNGDDNITLAASTGNDTIIFMATADGNDIISRFDFTTGEDVIKFGSAIDNRDFYSGNSFSSGTMTVQLVSAAATWASSTQVVVMRSGTFGNLADLMSAIATAGSMELSAADTTSAGNEVTVVWSDGVDSYVTLITLGSAVASGANGIIQATDSTQLLATLTNVNVAGISADQLQSHFTAF